MPRVFASLLALSLLPLLGSCGLVVQPRVSEEIPAAGRIPEIPSDPTDPAPSAPVQPQVRALVDQVCRTTPIPRGWVAVRYVEDRQACPKPVAEDNQYTLAVIHRYIELPVGALLTVCADQPVPARWVLDPGERPGTDCPGARVPEGEPSAWVIRRIR